MFASYFTIKSVSSSCVAYPYFKISHVELILNMYTESQSSFFNKFVVNICNYIVQNSITVLLSSML